MLEKMEGASVTNAVKPQPENTMRFAKQRAIAYFKTIGKEIE